MFGWIKGAMVGNDQYALLALAAAPIMSILVLLALGHDRRRERIPPAHQFATGD
jgi:hypothetical protein